MNIIITLTIILLYLGNIFLARYLNWKLCKVDKYNSPLPGLWFIPVMTIIVLVIILSTYNCKGNKFWDWFNGDNWENGTN